MVIHMLTIAYMLFTKVISAELWPHNTYFPAICYLYHRQACLDKKIKNVMSMKLIIFSRTGLDTVLEDMSTIVFWYLIQYL